MKRLMLVLFFLSLFIYGCACPSRDMCLIMQSPYTGMPVISCFEKGELSDSEEKRGYKVFDSLEEAREYLKILRNEQCPDEKESLRF